MALAVAIGSSYCPGAARQGGSLALTLSGGGRLLSGGTGWLERVGWRTHPTGIPGNRASRRDGCLSGGLAQEGGRGSRTSLSESEGERGVGGVLGREDPPPLRRFYFFILPFRANRQPPPLPILYSSESDPWRSKGFKDREKQGLAAHQLLGWTALGGVPDA